MADELLDVFDKKGNKIGTATWQEVHHKHLIHQVSAGLIFRDQTRKATLLQKRNKDAPIEPDLWTHGVGGHIRSGQTPEQGLLRELQEELFLDRKLPNNLEYKKITTYFCHCNPRDYEITHLFEVFYPGPFYPDPKEVAKIRWVEWDNLLGDMKQNPKKYTNFFQNMVKELQKHVYM